MASPTSTQSCRQHGKFCVPIKQRRAFRLCRKMTPPRLSCSCSCSAAAAAATNASAAIGDCERARAAASASNPKQVCGEIAAGLPAVPPPMYLDPASRCQRLARVSLRADAAVAARHASAACAAPGAGATGGGPAARAQAERVSAERAAAPVAADSSRRTRSSRQPPFDATWGAAAGPSTGAGGPCGGGRCWRREADGPGAKRRHRERRRELEWEPRVQGPAMQRAERQEHSQTA